jgi:polysaccharide export outer membrane protein
VLGEVRSPGRYPIESTTTVLDLIALAGGITEKGSDVVYILRPEGSGTKQLQVDTRSLLMLRSPDSPPIVAPQGGDSVIVPKGTFFINGQVAQPGEYRIEGEMVLFQAIARAGGVTPLGSASRVEIRRREADGKFVDIKGKKNMRIEPGDIIKIKERLF